MLSMMNSVELVTSRSRGSYTRESIKRQRFDHICSLVTHSPSWCSTDLATFVGDFLVIGFILVHKSNSYRRD